MAKDLVIVESPAKARTIERFLGNKYIAKASMGHVRDLPRREIGVAVDNEASRATGAGVEYGYAGVSQRASTSLGPPDSPGARPR